MKKLLIIIISTILLTGCSFTQEWTAFYYPDKNDVGNSSKWKTQSGFKTVEDCRSWVMQTAGDNTTFDYECGLNCKIDESGLNICKKTIK